ncbi:MAG: hypothetical protein Q4F49_08750, partial [Pseudoxanthomonas suwonensis]|nr:hypothetical protein [Pseudoxanthomonas suwonensis]
KLHADESNLDFYIRNMDEKGRDIIWLHGTQTNILSGRNSLFFSDERGECLICEENVRAASAHQIGSGIDDIIRVGEIVGSTFPKWYIQEIYGLEDKCYDIFARSSGSIYFDGAPGDERVVTITSNSVTVCFD